MSSLYQTVQDFGYLDQLAAGDSPVHRLDARAKVLVTLAFIVAVVSFDRHDISALLPFFIYPAALIAAAGLPSGYIARKAAMVLPFALAIGLFNPLFERDTAIRIGSMALSNGCISWLSIILRSLLTASSAIILVATTGFTGICTALQQLGAPQAFVVQLHVLYRYIFVLIHEAQRLALARELRSFGRSRAGAVSYPPLIGHLLLRTWQQAEHIHGAMLARGFSGRFHTRTSSCFSRRDLLFLTGWALLFLVMRRENVALLIGTAITGKLP